MFAWVSKTESIFNPVCHGCQHTLYSGPEIRGRTLGESSCVSRETVTDLFSFLLFSLVNRGLMMGSQLILLADMLQFNIGDVLDVEPLNVEAPVPMRKYRASRHAWLDCAPSPGLVRPYSCRHFKVNPAGHLSNSAEPSTTSVSSACVRRFRRLTFQ